jgi:adenylate cyclase
MGTEIERKFLVVGDGWRHLVTSRHQLVQGYLARAHGVSVRVRTIDEAEARLTIKSGESELNRGEFEYAIPLGDARELLDLCRPHLIEKTRHIVPASIGKWEIDVFAGRHDGLVVAEIELDREDTHFDRPEWLGAEVTGDERYYNAVLAGY